MPDILQGFDEYLGGYVTGVINVSRSSQHVAKDTAIILFIEFAESLNIVPGFTDKLLFSLQVHLAY
jgi:hypothetical protein